jgi:hypothetical protein
VGVNVTSQVAVFGPLELRPQLVLPNDPLVGAAENDTVPVGAFAPLDARSVTVTVHVAGSPVVTEAGEQFAAVVVGSTGIAALREPAPWLVLCPASPRYVPLIV